jgi:hypothetical protein
MPKANLTRGNSVTENYQPHAIDILVSVMQEFNKAMNPIFKYPKGNKHAQGGVAIAGEMGQELIIDQNTAIWQLSNMINRINKFEQKIDCECAPFISECNNVKDCARRIKSNTDPKNWNFIK